MKSILFITACLLSLPASVHAQAEEEYFTETVVRGNPPQIEETTRGWMKITPANPPDLEKDKASLHVQGVYGAIWLSDGVGLGRSDATSMKGLGVRAQYAFNRYIAVEGEIIGASTGEAQFRNVMYYGLRGDLTRSATLGRVQFGGVLRLGDEYVPILRLGVGGHGVSHSAELNGIPRSDVPFEFSALWYAGIGLDLRVDEHFRLGMALSSETPVSSESRSVEAGIHLGYAWKP